jgi:Pyruvate/2-oxoacid:ferredoxin oxidoreductase delta subunit
MKPSPGMSNTTWILVVVVIILVAAIGIAAAMILLTKEPLANSTTNNTTNKTGNFTPQSNTTTNNQTKSSGSPDMQNSGVNNVDLMGYTLVDVRRSSDTGNVRCRLCGEWTVQRTVYEYKNSAGEMVMIGENYCTGCGGTCKDYWEKGKWSDL